MTAQDSPRSWFRRWPILLGILTLLAMGQSRAGEWYLKMDGVPGAIPNGRFAGWTPVQAVGPLVQLPIDPTNGTPGPSTFSCEIKKSADAIGAFLLNKANTNGASRRMSLAYAPTPSNAPQYRITLENVLISSISQVASNGGPVPGLLETITLNFQKIEWACFELDANGGVAGGLTARFDQATGQGDLKPRLPFRANITRRAGQPGLLVTCPVEKGHGYRIRSQPSLGAPWKTLLEFTATEDGTSTQFAPTDAPGLFLRVEEVD